MELAVVIATNKIIILFQTQTAIHPAQLRVVLQSY